MKNLDICLVSPPFHSIHYPLLGPSVLKGALEARGLSTHVIYGGLMLAARTGLDPYDEVCRAPNRYLMGERLFRSYAYPPDAAGPLPETESLPEDLKQIYDHMKSEVGPALDQLVAEVLALRPRILGLSSTFEQNMASSAVAWRVKRAAPEICIVMGGANAAWPMSRGLAAVFPWFDYFFAGEADIDFPEFCHQLCRHDKRPAERVIRSEPIQDMSVVSAPDFTDMFRALRPLQASGVLPGWLPRMLPMETSRGCWWGAKHHCTFCGLNGELGMSFREKSTERVLAELSEISPWGIDLVWMTDNIMPRRYLKELLPALAGDDTKPHLFYEVKANHSEQEIDTMARGGVARIQPGIESLSSHVLELMRKGVSAHQNIALLRHCAGVGMWVTWNILYGFPGEAVCDYESTIAVMPMLEHLQPVTGAHKIIIDRFSPYFREPEALGIGPIQPFRTYYSLYPEGAAVDDIAYHYYGDYSTDLLAKPEVIERLDAAIRVWRKAWEKTPLPVLQVFDMSGTSVVLDTRSCAREHFTQLSDQLATMLRHFESPRLRATMDHEQAAAAEWLLERRFLIDHEGKLMSVVVRPRAEIAAVLKRAPARAADRLEASA